jgi:hypothetical protein
MADMKDFSAWAARKAGVDGVPEPADGGQDGGGDGGGDQEQVPPAHECLTSAITEFKEGLEFLEKAKGQVDDPDALQATIDELTETVTELTETADELKPEEGGDDDDEDEDEDEDARQASQGCVCGCRDCECGCDRGGTCVCGHCSYSNSASREAARNACG